MSIDRADDRNRAAINGVKRAIESIQQPFLISIPQERHSPQVEPSTKGFALACENNGADTRILYHGIENLSEMPVSSMVIAFAGGLCNVTVATGAFLLKATISFAILPPSAASMSNSLPLRWTLLGKVARPLDASHWDPPGAHLEAI
jgi:hypothetical protein